MVITLYFTMAQTIRILVRKLIKMKKFTKYDTSTLFLSTVPEYSLGYGEKLYKVKVPWLEYTTLSNFEIERDFDDGISQEIWRTTEHAVQRVLFNKK